MTVDHTQLILLKKYQSDSPLLQELLQVPVSLDESEELPAINECNSISSAAHQEASGINMSPVTRTLLRIIQKLHLKENDEKN